MSRLKVFVQLAWGGLALAERATGVVQVSQDLARKETGFKLRGETINLATPAEQAEELEKFAEAQKKHGFSYLYELASIRLWGILEALVDETCVRSLLDNANLSDLDSMKSLKAPVVEFLNLSEQEKAVYLVDLLKQKVTASLKPGIGRFESVLDQVGLGGGVKKRIRRTLLELSQIRNVLVHCNGNADSRIVKHCPWLGLKIDDKVYLTGEHFSRYITASYWYIVELSIRWDMKHPPEKPEEYATIEELKSSQDALLDRLEAQWATSNPTSTGP